MDSQVESQAVAKWRQNYSLAIIHHIMTFWKAGWESGNNIITCISDALQYNIINMGAKSHYWS